jgi:RNA polymerase sigma-70 factor, ECF subfamily
MDSSFTIRLPEFAVPKQEDGRLEISAQSSAAESSVSDELLIDRVCEGDREALASLFRRHARLVRGIAYRVLRDPSEADDLLQDIFLLIHRLCSTFDASKGSARFWIMQMAYRRAISRRRYLTSRHFYSQVNLDDAPEAADPRTCSGNFGERLADSIGQKGMETLFTELSDDQRQALLLRFVEGYTLDEIAKKLGQTRANIKNHYFRGLEKLRKHLFSGKSASKRAL